MKVTKVLSKAKGTYKIGGHIMANFANPYQGNSSKMMTKEELAQALRIDIAAELEAIFLYEAHAMTTDDKIIKKVLQDIADEEREHIGELLALVRYLDPKVADALVEGQGEVKEMMEELGIDEKVIELSTGEIPAGK